MDGPPPSDPSVLDGPAQSSSNGDAAPTVDTAAAPLLDAMPSSGHPTHAPTASLSAPRPSSPSVHSPTAFRQNTAHMHSQSRQLLSSAVAGRIQVPPPPGQSQPQQQQPQPKQQPPPQQPKPSDDLFSLDFHAPPVSKPNSPPQPPAKDVKQDILSLFSAPPSSAAPAQAIQPSNAFGQFAPAPSSWDALGIHTATAPQPQVQGQVQQPTSMMGTTGPGFWGVSSGWNGALPNTTPSLSGNMWGAPATNPTHANALNMVNTTDIWGGSMTAQASNGGVFAAQPAAAAPKKDDVFGDLWGDFK